MAEIIIKNIRKQFGDFVAVQESSFTVEDGEFFMLLGPSGCGENHHIAHDCRVGIADIRRNLP